MVLPGERGLSLGNQNEFLPTANELAEQIASLDEQILYEGPQGRRKAKRNRDDLFNKWIAYYPNHLALTPPANSFPSPVDHVEPVLRKPARKPALSRVRQLTLATLFAGAATVGAQAFEARADGPLPFQPKLTGSIDADTEIDFIQKENGVYAAKPMQLKKSGPETLTWIRFAATGGDLVNGWVKALEQYKARITGTLAQCADMIVSINKSSFADFGKQSSGRRMNTDASPVLVSVQPTMMVNGKIERNYCAVNNPDLLRVKPTRTPPAIVPPPAASENTDLEKRKSTLLGFALVTSVIGLAGSVFLRIRRRNLKGVGQTSLVPEMPIAYTAQLKPSNLAPEDTTRLDTPLERAVGDEAERILVRGIRDLNSQGEELTVHMGDLYAEIRRRMKASRPRSGPPPAKPG